MSCEHLVCANCAGPVVEGRCASCRATRSDVHRHASALTPQALAVLAILLAVLAALAALHVGGLG